jgi:hypothetical protein
MENVIVETVDGPNSNGFYDVIFDDGRKAATKNEDLAKEAFQSRGVEVPVVISERVNGRFTNIYLNEINGVKDSPKRGKAKGSAPAAAAPAPRDNDRIAKQWAIGRSVELLVGSGMEFAFPLDDATKTQLAETVEFLEGLRDK